MIKKFTDKHTIVFIFVVTLIIMAVFTASMFLFASIFNVDLTANEPSISFFITSILGKIVLAAIVVFLLIKFKLQFVMKLSSKGLLKGFLLGWFCILFPIVMFLTSFDFSKAGAIEQGKWILLLFFVVEMIFTGITEEFLCRGFIYNVIINKYNSVKQAVLVSAAIFGAVHIITLIYQPLISTLGTIVFAFIGGVLYAAIYARCQNIWPLVLLHAFWNIGISAAGILTPPETVVEISNSELILQFILMGFMFFLGMFLIRKRKTTEIYHAE
jgi:membrane protease YdiL (CAAX protease family)